jgi:hypothetical protein
MAIVSRPLRRRVSALSTLRLNLLSAQPIARPKITTGWLNRRHSQSGSPNEAVEQQG